MIDISNLVVKAVKEAVDDPDVFVTSNYIETLEKLPGVTVYEVENVIDRETMDCDGAEHYARVVYEIAVYTNNISEGKQLAKALFTRINDKLITLNFVRTFKGELPNVDRSVFRIQGRFEARVSENKALDGNTVNLIYRR